MFLLKEDELKALITVAAHDGAKSADWRDVDRIVFSVMNQASHYKLIRNADLVDDEAIRCGL